MKKAIAILCMLLLWSTTAVAEIQTISYTQYASGGTPTELEAVILFENSNSTFTKYQVAFTSCTCRGADQNYRSVLYIELLNTKPTAGEASIRQLTLGKDVKGNLVGLWGDSNPIYMRPDYTADYMDAHFVQCLVGATKNDFDAWMGYGDYVDVIEDCDAIAGATVSVSNITSVIKSLFDYHAAKYYSEN